VGMLRTLSLVRTLAAIFGGSRCLAGSSLGNPDTVYASPVGAAGRIYVVGRDGGARR